MPAGDVAGLVREHADDLVGRERFHQRADIDENAPRVGDKGVEGFVRDQHDLDILLAEIGGAQDRVGIFAQQLLDFGISDDRKPGIFRQGLRLRGGGRQCDRRRGQRGKRARDWPATAPLDKGGGHVHVVGNSWNSAQPIEAAAAGQITPKSVTKSLSFGMRKRRQKPFECGKTGARDRQRDPRPRNRACWI